MCATLVLVAAVNFLIDPKVVPGRAGLLVTLFLVLANFFSDAQVPSKSYDEYRGGQNKFFSCSNFKTKIIKKFPLIKPLNSSES